MRKQSCIFMAIMGLLLFPLRGQDVPIPMVKNYDGLDFFLFAETLEKSDSILLYFKEEWVRGIYIRQDTVPADLSDILQSTLQDSGLYFLQFDRVFILTGHEEIISDHIKSFSTKEEQSTQANISYERNPRVVAENPSTDRNRILHIGNPALPPGGRATLSGYIREKETGESIIGAVIYNEEEGLGVTSDINGYYVISLKKGRHLLTYRSLGKSEEFRSIILNGDGRLDLEMEEKINQLKGVVITADKYQNVSGMQIGLNRIDVSTIKQVPAIMGEADVLKVALLLPGVQTVGEGASGFNVRGGSTDQNLILINKAPVYNTSHLFGFFSAFNPDVIKDFKLYKSGIAAEYGGRISSVFDITTRDGNRKEFSGGGGISPVTGRLSLEGPIVRDKISFLAGIRSTYSDWILKRIPDPSIRNSSASFYDLNGKITWDINENNHLQISAYHSRDNFQLNSDTGYAYSNSNIVADWKHVFNQKMFGNITGIYSTYDYNILNSVKATEAFRMKYRIAHRELKAAITAYPAPGHRAYMGLNLIHYALDPGSLLAEGEQSLVEDFRLERENGLESALYISDEFQFSDRLSIYGGIRYSLYTFLGPKTVSNYYEGVPRDPIHIIDTTAYGKGEIIQTYHGPELRANLRYKLTGSSSLKLSYNRMRQYLHMLSNTTSISPTDTWKLSDSHIRPQVGDQLALGIYKDFRDQSIEASAEIYYKKITDIIEYKGGAKLILNSALEQDLINAMGKAYGAELMVERTSGKVTGWISYTYARILVQANSPFPVEQINEGEWFPANHDKPHDLTMVCNYKFNRRFSISTNLTYSTGRPITYPVAKYSMRGMTMLHYTYRNEYRIPDYFRWDLSLNLDGNLRSEKLAHSSWSASVYNLTGRDNVYSIYFVSSERSVRGYKLSIFSQPIFTLSYNFRF